MTPIAAILQFVVPAILIAVGLLVGGLLSARSKRQDDTPVPLAWRVFAPVLVAVAYWLADFGLFQIHPIWDRDGSERFLAVALAAGLVGVIHAAVRRRLVTVVFRCLLGAGTAFIVLLPLAGGPYMSWPLLVVLAVATGAWLSLTGGVLDGVGKRSPRLMVPLSLFIAASVSAPGLFACGYASGAMLAGSLAAIASGVIVTGVFARRSRVAFEGANTVWLTLFVAILLVTYGYTDVPAWWVLPIMAAAPLGLLAALLPRLEWQRFVAAALASILLAGGATLAATLSMPDDDAESPYGY